MHRPEPMYSHGFAASLLFSLIITMLAWAWSPY